MDRPRAWHSAAIDLSAEPKLRIGGATVDPVSREAEFPGGCERLPAATALVQIASTAIHKSSAPSCPPHTAVAV